MIRETLQHTDGDKSLAAQLLGISTRTIYRKLGEDRSVGEEQAVAPVFDVAAVGSPLGNSGLPPERCRWRTPGLISEVNIGNSEEFFGYEPWHASGKGPLRESRASSEPTVAFDALLKKILHLRDRRAGCRWRPTSKRGVRLQLVGAAFASTTEGSRARRRSRSRGVGRRIAANRTTRSRSRSRNPFDTTTARCTRNRSRRAAAPAATSAGSVDPLGAPAATACRPCIITESTDPTGRLRPSGTGGAASASLRRVGDDDGRQTGRVHRLQPDARTARPFGSPVARSLSGVAVSRRPPAPPSGAEHDRAAGAPRTHTGRAAGAPGVPADIASKIQKVSDTEFNIDRAVVDKILENQAS